MEEIRGGKKRARIHYDTDEIGGGGGSPYLPEEIIMEILMYMDAEDVNNFKLVSKFWLSAISNPDFGNTHFSRSSTKAMKKGHVILSTITKPTSLNSTSYVYRHFTIPNQNQNQHYLKKKRELQFPPNLNVEASLDGLLLLQDKYDHRQLYISNPITGAFTPLPPAGNHCADWALLRDTSLNKYIVFGLASQKVFHVLTLDHHQLTWKNIGVPKPITSPRRPPFRLLSNIFVAANNIVHWLSLDFTGVATGATKWPGAYIIYFACLDICKLGTIKVPQALVRPFYRHPREMADFVVHRGRHLLSEVKGKLWLTIVSTRHLEMFLLEDRENSIWIKSHRIDIQSFSKRPYFFGSFLLEGACFISVTAPDASDPLDTVKVLIHHKDRERLLLFDLKTQRLINFGFLSKDQKLCRSFTLHFSTHLSCPTRAISMQAAPTMVALA